jgi:hypothetical protein
MSWLRLMEEKIKEGGEGVTASAPPSPAGPAGRHRKRKVLKLIEEMWPAYLIEIFVIILGISITLALEEWRDKSKESELAAIYQKNLLADVDVDLASLKHVEQNTTELVSKGDELLDFIKNPSVNTLTSSRADSDIRAIIGRTKFISSDATFSDLKNSGNLHLLGDIQLKNLLFAYYSLAQNIKETQDAEQQATIIISGPYFLKHFPLSGAAGSQPVMDPQQLQALARDVEFGNNVLLRVENRKELLGDYKMADSLGGRLREVLVEKVKE